MANKLERTYNIPLRKEWLKTAKKRRAKRAVNALKLFLSKHMKSDNIKIGRIANMELWKRGIKSPPHHIQVKATKDDEGVVRAELVGFDFEIPKKKEAKKPKSKLQETAEKIVGKGKKEEKLDAKVKKVKEEKQEKAKEIEKEELKEIKKEPAKKPVEVSVADEKEAKIIEKKDIKSSSGKEKGKDNK